MTERHPPPPALALPDVLQKDMDGIGSPASYFSPQMVPSTFGWADGIASIGLTAAVSGHALPATPQSILYVSPPGVASASHGG